MYCCLICFSFMPIIALSSTYLETDLSNKIIETSATENRALKFPMFPFIMIHVKAFPCNGTKDRNGTCYTKEACRDKGGESDGTCGVGFGVCCLLERRCGSIIKDTNTILVNDDYPKLTNKVGNCQYIVEKANDDICQLRLDFDEFHLAGPDNATSLCKEDTFSAFSSALENSGIICGENSGQHMYLDLSSGSGTARINIAISSASTQRSWKIRASQVSCNSEYRAPPNCLQYFPEYSGIIKSFNYQTKRATHQIGSLSYTICVKSKEGFCGIIYHAEDFSLSGNNSKTGEALAGDDTCTEDFVFIFVQDKSGIVGEDRYCGAGFNDTSTYSKPFQIKVITNALEPATDVFNKGFIFKYMQTPC